MMITLTSENKRVLALVAVALLIRLVSFFTFGFIDSGGGSDSVTYLLLAKNLFTGQGFTEFGVPHLAHPPFYPLMIGSFWKLTGDLLSASQLVSVLTGALLVIPVYSLACRLFNPVTGWYAALAAAIFPILIYGSVETFAESLYTFLLLAGMALFWRSFQTHSLPGMIAAGICIGLAFLTHPSGLAFAPVLIVFLVIGQFTPERTRWGRLTAGILLFLLGFCLICLPFWLHLHRVTGAWSLSGSSYYQDLTFRLRQARGAPESEIIFRHMESIYHPEPAPPSFRPIGLFSLALYEPRRFMQLIKFNLQDGWREVQKTAGFLGLSTIALVLVLGVVTAVVIAIMAFNLIRKKYRLPMLYLALLFLPSLVFVLITIEHRYFYPFIPLGLILLAWLAAEAREKIVASGFRIGRIAFNLGAAFLVAALLLGSLAIVYRKWKKVGIPYEYKLLGDWMRTEIPGVEKENVMMFRMGVSYYAGCRWNVFFWGDYPALVRYLEGRDINYLVIDDYKLHMIHPDLRFLLTADPPPPEFKVMKEVEFQGRKARLLKKVETKK